MRTAAGLLIVAIILVPAIIAITLVAPAAAFHGGNLTRAFAVVEFKNGTCQPADVYVYKNGTVVWTNPGPEEHAVVVGDDISPPLLAGESFAKNFHEFGVFDYYCRYHPSGRGRVIVR